MITQFSEYTETHAEPSHASPVALADGVYMCPQCTILCYVALCVATFTGSGAPLVWNVSTADASIATNVAQVQGSLSAGALYVYKRSAPQKNCTGGVTAAATWSQKEHFKIQAHDGYKVRDRTIDTASICPAG